LDKVFQAAYIVRDLEKGVATIRAQAEIRTEIFYEAGIPVRRPSGPEVMTIKVAFLWIGDFQYELIQPISGLEDVYGAYMPDDDRLVFHHTCVRLPEWENFRRAVDEQPYPVVFEGGNGPNYFLYLDARKTLGHFLEYAYLPGDTWTAVGGR
jgi:hypothetical protein